MPIKCCIQFNGANGVFYSGQELSGNVRIENDKEEQIRAISITVVGQAEVFWAEIRRYYTALHSAEEMYLSSCIYVVGCAGGSALTLKPGTYDYQFKIILPSPLPTSFNSEYGSVKYYVKVTISRVWHFDDVFKEGFTVIHLLDLNIDPKYREPQIRDKSKQFCCWCCKSGNLNVKLTIPALGFIPGQLISFNILVDNESNHDIKNVSANILQEVQFTSTSPSERNKHTKEVIQKKMLGKILKYSKKELKDNLMVPQTPQSTVDTSCKCIRIEYYFFVVAETGCCSTDLKLFTKILIGSIPIYAYPTDPNLPITTQPTITQTEPLLPNKSDTNIVRSYNSFN